MGQCDSQAIRRLASDLLRTKKPKHRRARYAYQRSGQEWSHFHKWKGEHDQAVKRKRQLSDNKRALYMVVWGQCSPAMQSKIKSSLKYKLMNQECDVVWLLKEIQSVIFKFDDHNEMCLAMDNAIESLGTCKQEEGESVSNFLQQFQLHIDEFEHLPLVGTRA